MAQSTVDALVEEYNALRCKFFSTLPEKTEQEMYKQMERVVRDYLMSLPQQQRALEADQSRGVKLQSSGVELDESDKSVHIKVS